MVRQAGDVPNLFVLSGPNGAGKTTIHGKILAGTRRVAEYVNADNIAAELEGHAGAARDFHAGRLMLARLDKLTEKRLDLAFETTLASRSLLRRISSMRDAGYLFHLIYLWLPSPDLAIQRVASRVKAGGHSIPEDVIRRRFSRSISNFFNVYRPFADSWLMLDNSHVPEPRGIAWRNVGGAVQWDRNGPWEQLRSQYETDPFR